MSVQVSWTGGTVVTRARAAAAQGLKLAAEHVLGEATKVVPIEEGTLSGSGATSADAGSLTASVSYDTPYAVRQHEDLTLSHAAGRTAKYLEGPFLATASQQQQIVGEQIRRALG